MRLNKYLAHCGIGTRRQSEEFVRKGKVKINGEVIDNPSHIVQPADTVTYNDKPLHLQKGKAYLLMNKPKGFSCTFDLKNNKSVAEILKGKFLNEVTAPLPLGDNDLGLILLTDDDKVLDNIMAEGHKIKQIFEVTLEDEMSAEVLHQPEQGVEHEGTMYKLEGISFLTDQPASVVGIECHQNTTKYIYDLFARVGHTVVKLDRTYIAGLTKKDLPRGFFRSLTEKEIIFARHFY